MKMEQVPQKGRKHCGKRKNCLLRAISPFPTVFSKDMHCRHVTTRACLGKGYSEILGFKVKFWLNTQTELIIYALSINVRV